MNRLKYIRKASGVTLLELAGYTGISKTLLSDVENGDAPLYDASIEVLIRFFGCTSDYLLGFSDWGVLVYGKGDRSPHLIGQREFGAMACKTSVVYTGAKVEVKVSGRATPSRLVCSHTVYREMP